VKYRTLESSIIDNDYHMHYYYDIVTACQ